MDPPGHTPGDKHDARQSARPEQSAARTAETVAVYLAHLLWDAAVYLGEVALDLIYSVRVGLLMRSQTKFPERAREFDAQMARLKEQKSGRWSSWEILSGGRRLQIRFAATVIVVAAIFGLRAYLGRGAKSELSSPEQVAYQPTPVAPSTPAPRAAISSAVPSAAPTVNQARVDAGHFAEYRRKAAPGDWIVYGVEPVQTATAELAEAEAQKKSAEAAALAAYHKFDALKDEERSQSAIRQMRGAENERSTREEAYSDARNALYRARYPELRPVLERGDVHDFDGFKVMSPVVIKEGNRYRMWYVGCHFIGDDYTCGVGHAESSDGVIWKKSRAPVLTIEDRGASQDLHSITVVRGGNGYLMWYALDSNPLSGSDCATLNLATSRDGLAWKHDGLTLKTNCQNAGHLWQSAFYDGRNLHLWYADYDSSATGSLTHLTSVDGKNWQKGGSTDIGTLGADPGRLWVTPDHAAGYRALFAAPDQSGYFGMLQSVDGNVWKTGGDAPKLADLFKSGDDGKPEAPAELVEAAGTWMWFAVPNTRDGSEEIALAFQKEAPR